MSENESIHYGGLGRRFAALVFDFLILSILFFPITKAVKGVWIMHRADHLWRSGWFVTDPVCIIFLVVIVVYFIFTEGIWGATIGKRLTGLRVVLIGGGNPGLSRAAVRNFLRVVDALPALNILGIILIFSSPEKARFGDRIAGTRVVVR
jgi:uncharacterized RDD family membrane protein YckC